MRVRIPRFIWIAVLTSLVAVLLAACGSSDDSGSTSASTTGTAAASSGGGGGGGGEGGTVGFSIPQGADPSLQLLDGGIKAEAKKAGLDVKTVDAALDPNKQLADLDTFIQQKVKAIIVWPLDSNAIQPAVQRAKDANIPAIAIYALAGGPYYTDIIIDGKGVGADGAASMAQALGKGAKVAAIFGPPQVDQFREIGEGFKAGASDNGLDLVESQVDGKISPETAATLTQDFKQRYGKDLKGLWTSTETEALGASSVLGGDFNPQITTYGSTDEALKGLKDGKFSAVVFQNSVLIGRIAGWAAGQAVAGETVPDKLYVQPPVIDQKAAETFPSTAEQLTKEYDFTPQERDGKSYMELFK